jgi:hypothetical protein
MKLAIFFSVTIAAAAGAFASPASLSLVLPFDAQPEGLVAGTSLLMVAWLLRQGLSPRATK